MQHMCQSEKRDYNGIVDLHGDIQATKIVVGCTHQRGVRNQRIGKVPDI